MPAQRMRSYEFIFVLHIVYTFFFQVSYKLYTKDRILTTQ
jgi:hypothetical protein